MIVNAYAKINIGLDVRGKRPDGYHEVRMIMQTIDLHDKLDVSLTDEPGIFITTDRDDLPVNEDNLIYKAASLMLDEFSPGGGVRVDLVKNIPIAAGLAGGSADAAAVMCAINSLCGLGLTKDRLMRLGVRIGADVPYCIMGGTALAEGIGEVLTRVRPFPECGVLLAGLPISVSTAYVYKHLKTGGIAHPDIEGIISGIENGDLHDISACMGNVLESVTIPENPIIGKIKEIMTKEGCVATLMSGSGPSVFGLYDSEDSLNRGYERLAGSGLTSELFISKILNP